MAAVALICMTVFCISATSCSSDDDDDIFVRYDAVTVGDNLFGQMVCNEMESALKTAFGSGSPIRVCDAVAEKVRDNNLVGTIQLTVTFASTDPHADNKTNVIKTYKFPF